MILLVKKLLYSFPPIIGMQPKVMILGSMPSVTSLEKQEYYGYKHNRFWKIIAQYFKEDCITYEQKQACIQKHHILLWDVIASCEREGSLDSNIKKVIVNPIDKLLAEHKSIEAIICNGKKSYQLYQKYFSNLNITCYCLASTSNANQMIHEKNLFHQWQDVFAKYNL